MRTWMCSVATSAVAIGSIGCSSPAASSAPGGTTLPDVTSSFDAKNADGATDSGSAAADGAGVDIPEKPPLDAAAADATVADAAQQDTPQSDTPQPDTLAADAAGSDGGAKDTAAADGAATDSAASDAATADSGSGDAGAGDVAAVCKASELKRCWVECPQSYAAGCISGGVPILILGVQKCQAGSWGACEVGSQCADFANGPCTPNAKASDPYVCTDGTKKVGEHLCTKPLGANCQYSYYINWPLWDCPMLCDGPDDLCTAEQVGTERACEAHCGSPTGPTVPGKQKCQDVCNANRWMQCMTGEACGK